MDLQESACLLSLHQYLQAHVGSDNNQNEVRVNPHLKALESHQSPSKQMGLQESLPCFGQQVLSTCCVCPSVEARNKGEDIMPLECIIHLEALVHCCICPPLSLLSFCRLALFPKFSPDQQRMQGISKLRKTKWVLVRTRYPPHPYSSFLFALHSGLK